MAVVTDKIRSVVDFFVKGFEPKETIFDEMGDEVIEDEYEVEDNLAIDPANTYQQRPERTQDLKVVNHPNRLCLRCCTCTERQTSKSR